MTDETQGVNPVEDAPVLPVETQDADSSPAVETQTPDDTGTERPRDEDGKFLSEKAQKRIDRLTWEKNEREREAEYWRNRATQIERQPEPAPVPVGDEPTLDGHGYDEAAFKVAWVKWNEANTKAIVAAELKAEREAEKAQKQQQTFAQRMADAVKAKPELAEIAQDKYLPVSAAMTPFIVGSELGPDILLWIGQNREQAARIYDMPPAQAERELIRLETRLEMQREAQKRPSTVPTVSKAPPPPPRVEDVETSIAGVKPSDAASDKLSDAEWQRLREKELKRKKA